MQTCGHEHHAVERKMFAEDQGLWETSGLQTGLPVLLGFLSLSCTHFFAPPSSPSSRLAVPIAHHAVYVLQSSGSMRCDAELLCTQTRHSFSVVPRDP